MNYHAQLHHPDAPRTESESMAVAFSNLLMRLDITLEPLAIQTELDTKELTWDAITAIESRLMPVKIGEYGTWPEGQHSIVKFRYLNSEGQAVDHYSLLANPANQTIIDSYDARTKHAGMYGEPTGWATYALDVPDDEEDPVEEPTPEPETPIVQRSGMLYKVLSGENIWRVSRRFDIPVDKLLAHNELTNPNDIQAGMNIYIPLEHAQEAHKPIVYEVLPHARPMHVSHPEGAKRWSFGNVKTWKDVKDNGQLLPQNHNLWIAAIAHVPIEGDIAAYYMDQNSLGDYKSVGRVRYMLGFNWSHLADGHVTSDYIPEPIIDEETAKKIEEALVEQKEFDQIAADLEAIEAEVEAEPEPDYKDTYWAFEAGPVEYSALNAMLVFDCEEVKPPRPMAQNQPVVIAGTFEKDGAIYGRPEPAVKHGWWYGVPMDNLFIEDELYNTDVDLTEKVALRRELSLDEKLTVIVSRNIARVEKWRTRFVKK